MEVSTLIQEVVDSMVINLEIFAIRLDSSNYKCYTQNTQYLSLNARPTIDGNAWKVVAFSLNEYITLEPIGHSESITVGSYPISNPTFKFGKYKAVNSELSKKDGLTVNPLLWQLELLPRTKPQDKATVIESEGSVKLFFLNTASWEDFTTEQHYEQVIKPLDNLITEFKTALDNHRRTGLVYEVRRLNHAKFSTGGNSISESPEKQILGYDRLSGIEIEYELPIRIDLNCETRVIPPIEGGAFDSSFDSSFKRS